MSDDNGGMTQHTQLIDAVAIRTAVRDYDADPIDDDQIRQLSMTIDAVNTLSGLSMQFVTDKPQVFADANASGHLHNAANYIAVIGPKNDDEAKEQAGFYAERIVLTATQRGLGTLWVGGSWDPVEAAKYCRISGKQELYVGIIVGLPHNHLSRASQSFEELCEYQHTHRASKSFEEFTAGMSDAERAAAPEWFRAGVEAAMKAPSAMNRQPILFTYDAATDTATASIDPAVESRYTYNDLGIAKLHFQIGAGQGSWTWGDEGRFTRG